MNIKERATIDVSNAIWDVIKKYNASNNEFSFVVEYENVQGMKIKLEQ